MAQSVESAQSAAHRSVCIIDNSLKDFTGHHFEYVRSLTSALQDRKIRALVLANHQALPEFDKSFNVERVFRRSHYEWPCRIRKIGFFVNLWILNRSFYVDLERALRGRVDSTWLLFAPNVNHLELFAWARWLGEIPDAKRPQIRLFMRWSYFQNEDPAIGERFTFIARWALRKLERFPQVRLVTDSTQLAREFSTLSRLPVDVLPIPHTHVPVSAAVHPDMPVAVFLGGARSEKGFPVFVEAARGLQDDPVKLVAQCNVDDPDDKAAAIARAELEKLEGERVQLVRESVDSARYYEILSMADIVVLPYRERNYRARTSGVLVEALAAGKPVVVTKGTWLAEQALQAKVGLSFEDGNAQDLRRGILEVASKLDDYRQRAMSHREEWISFHNPSRMIEMLLA